MQPKLQGNIRLHQLVTVVFDDVSAILPFPGPISMDLRWANISSYPQSKSFEWGHPVSGSKWGDGIWSGLANLKVMTSSFAETVGERDLFFLHVVKLVGINLRWNLSESESSTEKSRVIE